MRQLRGDRFLSLRRRLGKARPHFAIAGVDPAQALLGEIVKARTAERRECVLHGVGFIVGKLPAKPALDGDFHTTAVAKRTAEIAAKMEALEFNGALEIIWEVIRGLNARVNEKAPWKLAKTDMAQCELVLFDLVWSLRIVSGWLEPFMPRKSAEMQMQLGVRRIPDPLTVEDVLAGVKEHPGQIQKGPVLFPRKV